MWSIQALLINRCFSSPKSTNKCFIRQSKEPFYQYFIGHPIISCKYSSSLYPNGQNIRFSRRKTNFASWLISPNHNLYIRTSLGLSNSSGYESDPDEFIDDIEKKNIQRFDNHDCDDMTYLSNKLGLPDNSNSSLSDIAINYDQYIHTTEDSDDVKARVEDILCNFLNKILVENVLSYAKNNGLIDDNQSYFSKNSTRRIDFIPYYFDSLKKNIFKYIPFSRNYAKKIKDTNNIVKDKSSYLNPPEELSNEFLATKNIDPQTRMQILSDNKYTQLDSFLDIGNDQSILSISSFLNSISPVTFRKFVKLFPYFLFLTAFGVLYRSFAFSSISIAYSIASAVLMSKKHSKIYKNTIEDLKAESKIPGKNGFKFFNRKSFFLAGLILGIHTIFATITATLARLHPFSTIVEKKTGIFSIYTFFINVFLFMASLNFNTYIPPNQTANESKDDEIDEIPEIFQEEMIRADIEELKSKFHNFQFH